MKNSKFILLVNFFKYILIPTCIFSQVSQEHSISMNAKYASNS